MAGDTSNSQKPTSDSTSTDKVPFNPEPGAGMIHIAKILTQMIRECRPFPTKAKDSELLKITDVATYDLRHALQGTTILAGPLHAILAITLAEQQRRLIDESLNHSRQMADEASQSAKLATNRVWIGIGVAIASAIVSGIIGLVALCSSNRWENKQMEALSRIEKRIPTTQPAKENCDE